MTKYSMILTSFHYEKKRYTIKLVKNGDYYDFTMKTGDIEEKFSLAGKWIIVASDLDNISYLENFLEHAVIFTKLRSSYDIQQYYDIPETKINQKYDEIKKIFNKFERLGFDKKSIVDFHDFIERKMFKIARIT